ncbi:MAG: hydrolase [Glaciecola sp.]
MTQTRSTQLGRKIESSFQTAGWLKNSHVQTIVPKFLLSSPVCKTVNERIKTPDNDFIDLAWSVPPLPCAVMVIFHGLEGSVNSHYVQHLMHACYEANITCVLMHFRGCSGEPNLQTKAYHSGATFDPEFVIPLIKARYANLPLVAVGFSLGGNMLMKLMAHRSDLPISASVAVSAPLNLAACSSAINVGFSRVYQWHLMKSMKANLMNKMAMIDMTSALAVSPAYVKQMRTFYEFDNDITAVLHGFDGAEDYYEKCSALPDLPLINKPTLIIHATDDPFMDEGVIPSDNAINEHVAYEFSQYGGHVGFMQNIYGSNKLWLPSRIVSFFKEVL